MIVTVTLNPALHVGYEAERVMLGRANPVSRVRYQPGGRGLAVARVLHTFGHEVVAAGPAGYVYLDAYERLLPRVIVMAQAT